MFENAIYSVISPEGCATILWRDPKKMLDAARAMKLSARDLLELKIIDEILKDQADQIDSYTKTLFVSGLGGHSKTKLSHDTLSNEHARLRAINLSIFWDIKKEESEDATPQESPANNGNLMIGPITYTNVLYAKINSIIMELA